MINKIQISDVAPNPKQRSDLSPQSGSKSSASWLGVDTHDQVRQKISFCRNLWVAVGHNLIYPKHKKTSAYKVYTLVGKR